MIQTAPSPIDILDFQFKLQCRLKVFQHEDIPLFNARCNILAVASRYGLLFVGSNSSSLQVIQLQNIQKYSTKDGEITNYLRRNISLPSSPQHLSVNCDCTKLSVVVKKDGCIKAIVYDILSFFQQNVSIVQEIRLSPTPGVNVLEAAWNPTVPSMYAVCRDDDSLGVYDLKGSGIEINELPKTTGATCMCWSPKGKQIAVGSRDGKITQYKPDLKIAKVVNSPPLEGSQFPIALQWITSYQFIAVYRASAADSQSSLIIINSPKVGEITYINYEDICYSYGAARPHQFYMLLQNTWNILMVASSNSMEVGVLGFEKDVWTQWILSDSARAELPLSVTKQDTLPIGLCLDTSSTQPLSWGESVIPPAPLLLLLSHHGILCCFHAVNLKEGAAQICRPPEALPGGSTTTYFTTSSEKAGPLPNKPIPINPTKQNIPISVQQPVTTTFSFTFNQPSIPITVNPNLSSKLTGQPFLIPTQASKPEKEVTPVQSIFNLKSTAGTVSTSENMTVPNSKPSIGNHIASLYGKAVEPAIVKIPSKLEPSPVVDANEDTDALIAQMVKEECIVLESELKILLQQGQNIKVDLGTDSEATNLVQNTNNLQEFLDEISEICQMQSAEIHCLKQTLIQTWAWYEEARSRFATDKDPTMVTLMRAQPLDAASARQLEEIHHLLYYLESQLSQANAALDEQWETFQDSCKKKLSLKLPSIEAIYQAMVKQSATIQKQVYMLKDISNRIKTKVRTSTIPHLLVSLDNVDTLEQQLKILHIDAKDIFQLQYEKVFERQKQLSTNKVRELRNFLKNRHITHVAVSKPQLLNSTVQLNGLINAPFSPIVQNKKLQPQKLNFIQSTPKPADQKDATMIKNRIFEKPSKVEPTNELIGIQTNNLIHNQNSVPQESMNFQLTHDKITFSVAPTKSSDVAPSNTNIFGFGEVKTSPGSAFVPTMQNVFGIKNTLFAITTASSISTSKPVVANSDAQQDSIFSFNTSVPPVNKPVSTNTTSVSIFSTPISSTGTDSIQKPSLFITKPPSTAVPTSKFIFGASSSPGVSTLTSTATSTVDTSSKLAFNFSNLPTKIDNTAVPTNNDLNTKSIFSNNTLSSNSTFPAFKALDSNSGTLTSKSLFSTVSTTSSVSKPLINTSTTSNALATSSTFTTPSIFNAKAFEISTITINSKTPISLPSSTTSTTTASTLPSTQIIQTAKSINTLGITSITNASPLSTSLSNQIGTSVTITPITSSSTQPLPTSSVPSAQIAPIVLQTGVDLTTANKTLSKISNVTTSTTTIASAQSKVTVSSSESKSIFNITTTGLSTTAVTATTASVFSGTTASIIFGGLQTTPTSSIFGVSQQSTPSVFGTTQQPSTSSTFGGTQQTLPSIFGGSQKTITSGSIFGGNSTAPSTSIFGAPQTSIFGTNVTTSTAAITTPAIQSVFGTSNASSTTNPSIFGTTTVPSSTTHACIFGTATVPNSTTQTSIFGTTSVPSSTTQASIFGTSTAPSSTTQASLFGTTSTLSETTQTPTFGSGNMSSSTTQTSIFGTNTISISTPQSSVFGTPTTQTSIFGTPNASGSMFGTSTTGSIFPAIKTTASGVFGSVPSTFSTANTTSTGFFTPASSTQSIFGQPASFGSSSIFSTPTNTNAGNIFGGASTAPTNVFGNAATTSFGTSPPFGSIFGSSTNNTSSPFGSTNDSFRFPATAGANTSSSSGGFGFSKPSFGNNSSSADTTSFSFGNLGLSTTTSSTFGSGFAQNPFGRTSNQEQQKSPFSGGSLFGSPTATSSSNIFGGTSPFNKTTPAFGGPATFGSPSAFGQQGSTFGQSTFGSTGSMFGSSSQPGPFSGSTPSVSQSGFGAPPVFGSSQAFGSASPGGFGAPAAFGSPTFGMNSSFNTSNKLFSSAPTDTFGSSNQQNSTFANLANQQTLGFGSLAQQSQTPTSQSTFSGGSSFSNWR